jgi:hypothetical protein
VEILITVRKGKSVWWRRLIEWAAPQIEMRILGTLAASLATVAISGRVLAQQKVEVQAGAGVPVCEEYLRSLKEWTKPAMRCLADLPLNSRELKRPSASVTRIEFTSDEDDPTMKLRQHAWAFVRKHDVNEANYFYPGSLSDWHGAPDQLAVVDQELANLSSRYFSDSALRILAIDVDNDGTRDRVLVYPRCVFGGNVVNTTTYSSPILLKKESDHADTDTEGTINYLRAPYRAGSSEKTRTSATGKSVAVADIFKNGAYGFLTFRGRTYFDFWWDAVEDAIPQPRSANLVRVYLPKKPRSTQVCSFRISASE